MTDPERTAVVGGIGESRFSRRSNESAASLQFAAIDVALRDAGVRPGDIDALLTESAHMPALLPSDLIEASYGMTGIHYRGYFGAAGIGLGLATMTAAQGISTGAMSAALVYFCVKWGSTDGAAYAMHQRYPAKSAFEQPYGMYGQPTYFALMARRYAHEFGFDEDDLATALGGIAVDQRSFAQLNDNAQMREPLTFEDYLDGRMIADPLRLHDCCLTSDGAVAFVITSLAAARKTERRYHAAVLGGGYASSAYTEEDAYRRGSSQLPAARRSAERAFAAAGILPTDVCFAEIYDCFTIAVLLQLEQLGVCEPGEGPEYLGRDARIAINTHGGSLSQAYLLGANHYTEAVRQVRGEGGRAQLPRADVGVISCAPSNDHATVVLGRTE